ncbi:hypothetical protein AAY473_037296 [Plecturocebus cupreus]
MTSLANMVKPSLLKIQKISRACWRGTCNPSYSGGVVAHASNRSIWRPRWVDHGGQEIETILANMIMRSEVRDQPDPYGENLCLLKIQKLGGCGGLCLQSQLLGRLRQNCLNSGGTGCHELRSHHCTPAWATKWVCGKLRKGSGVVAQACNPSTLGGQDIHRLGVVAHTCNPSTLEAKAGGSPEDIKQLATTTQIQQDDSRPTKILARKRQAVENHGVNLLLICSLPIILLSQEFKASLGNTARPHRYKCTKKLARHNGTYLWSQLLRRVRWENCLSLGGRGCSREIPGEGATRVASATLGRRGASRCGVYGTECPFSRAQLVPPSQGEQQLEVLRTQSKHS